MRIIRQTYPTAVSMRRGEKPFRTFDWFYGREYDHKRHGETDGTVTVKFWSPMTKYYFWVRKGRTEVQTFRYAKQHLRFRRKVFCTFQTVV